MKKTLFRSLAFAAITLFYTTLAPAAPAPDASWPTDGDVLSLEQLRGKVVYLDFWASWCAPCRESFPWMNELQARFAEQGLVVVAVNVDKERELVEQFLAKYPAAFTVAYDPDGKSAEQFKVKGMPSSYLIDRNGDIRFSHIGFRDKDRAELESRIQAVLTQ